MNAADSLRQFALVPPDDALLLIRTLLAEEAEAERRGQPRRDDLALLCCIQLFSRGVLEDVLRIWGAKRSGFDLGIAIDVQLLCGAGIDETIRFLSGHESAAAAQALAYINQCRKGGDFNTFSPEAHLNHYRRYFGVA